MLQPWPGIATMLEGPKDTKVSPQVWADAAGMNTASQQQWYPLDAAESSNAMSMISLISAPVEPLSV